MKPRIGVTVPAEVKDFLDSQSINCSALVAQLLTAYKNRKAFEYAHPEYKFLSVPIPLEVSQHFEKNLDVAKLANVLKENYTSRNMNEPFTIGDRTYIFGKPESKQEKKPKEEEYPGLKELHFPDPS